MIIPAEVLPIFSLKKPTRLTFITLKELLWFVTPCSYKNTATAGKHTIGIKRLKLLPFFVLWRNFITGKQNQKKSGLLKMILTYRNVADWFKARWWCHGNISHSDEASAVGTPSSSTEENCSQKCQQTSLRFQSCGLKHDGYFMLWALETHFFITSHQKTSRRLSFSRPLLLMKTVVWRSDPTLVLLHREVVLTREKGQKSAQASAKTWSLQDPAAELVCGSSWVQPVHLSRWAHARPSSTSPVPVQAKVTWVSPLASVWHHPPHKVCDVQLGHITLEA